MSEHSVAIVTGTSRGLGEAIALELLSRGTPVLAIARSASARLNEQAEKTGTNVQQLQLDLSHTTAVPRLQDALKAHLAHGYSRFLLVNNAGSVHPIAQTDDLLDTDAIAAAFTLNVASVMALCAAFLQTAPAAGERRILNISSGAGRGPVAGWGVYCATKAAIDMYTQVLAAEHPDLRAVSLAPGVIDTAMQATIRSSDTHAFPNVARFIGLHKDGHLTPPATAARHIVDYLDRDDFGTTVLDDIRHYA